jgi:hypothetical protein
MGRFDCTCMTFHTKFEVTEFRHMMVSKTKQKIVSKKIE